MEFLYNENEHPVEDLFFENKILEEKEKPFLFCYTWNIPTLILGFGQNKEELNYKFCNEKKIKIVKRNSGGKAIFHYKDLSISLMLPSQNLYAKSLKKFYDFFIENFQSFLKLNNFETKRTEKNEENKTNPFCLFNHNGLSLSYENKVFCGFAQIRKTKNCLVHCFISLNENYDFLKEIFSINKNKLMNEIGSISISDKKEFSYNFYKFLKNNFKFY